MSTFDRAELSPKNPYYLPTHRYRELRHHCLQYPDWRSQYGYLVWPSSGSIKEFSDSSDISNPVEKAAIRREVFARRMRLIEEVVLQVDADIYPWLLRGVTEEVSYENLHLVGGLPMSRNSYYQRYHKFFWVLDQVMTAREEQGVY